MTHQHEAEAHVIGAAMLDADAIDVCRCIVTPEDFSDARLQRIWRGILDVSDAGRHPDMVILATHFEKTAELQNVGGFAYLSNLADKCGTAVNVEHHARAVAEHGQVRRLRAAVADITARIDKGNYDDAQALAEFATEQVFAATASAGATGTTSHAEAMQAALRALKAAYEAKTEVTGTPTGFRSLDELTSGWQPGDLVIVAARPSMGKTALALAMLKEAARTGCGALMASLEMGAPQLAARMISTQALVSMERIRAGNVGPDELGRIVEARMLMEALPIQYMDDGAITVSAIRAKARRMKATEAGLGLIVVDYLQLMHGEGRSREEQVARMSRGLKMLAREIDVPVIALSQLNRGLEQRADKRPMMSDLRESGAIEQDADLVAFVYRDEVYNPQTEDAGIAEVIIRKHRNGRLGTVRLTWSGEFVRFGQMSGGL